MFSLALSPDEYDAYLDALTDSHQIRVDVRIHDQNEKEISSLTAPQSRIVSGAVQVDATASVTRSLSLEMVDPNRTLKFEANSPANGAIYADRFISARYQVRVAALEAWVTVPVFWGPVSSYERAGASVSIEAQGKEALMLEPHFAHQGYTIHAGTRLDDAIRRVAEKCGERKFDLPDLPHHLTRSRVVFPMAEPWKILNGGKKVTGFRKRSGLPPHSGADQPHGGDLKAAPGLVSHGPGDRKAYYNGQGALTIRKLGKSTSFSFHQGVHLTEPPSLSYDLAAFRNHVVVLGGRPKGKKRAHGSATLQGSHPLSPGSLSRNGEPRYLTEFIEAEGLKTDAKCRERAREVLRRKAREGVEAQFSSLPIPHLEEDDQLALHTDDGVIHFPLRQFTLPLVSSEAMSINFLKRVRPAKVRVHHRHHGFRQGGGGVRRPASGAGRR